MRPVRFIATSYCYRAVFYCTMGLVDCLQTFYVLFMWNIVSGVERSSIDRYQLYTIDPFGGVDGGCGVGGCGGGGSWGS